ncbi:ATP-binding protein [Streptomyces violascens]|uniref:ATP-binding protein n=1 Tax=Streptomyces violascens TaxID=67381 RepID=UPI0036937F41
MLTTCSAAACPAARPAPIVCPPPPEGLSLSLTLPGEPHCAGIARSAVRSALHAHALDPFVPEAVLAASELVAVAAYLNPSQDLYLSLRHRDSALRLIVYDAHARHAHPRLATACDARRRSGLRLLAAVVRDCGGDWGFGESREPGGGTRSWAVLPCLVN